MKRMWSKNELKSIADTQAKAVKKDIATLVDAQGHNRFVEGDGTPTQNEGLSNVYCKWSLSGSHLMLVLAGQFAEDAEVAAYEVLASFVLPEWVYAKIYPVWSAFLEKRTIHFVADNWTEQTIDCALQKSSDNTMIITSTDGVATTFTLSRGFRISFDLMIDNE